MAREGLCKHYNGSFHNTHCNAGVCYRYVTPRPDEPGSIYRKPCNIKPGEHSLKLLAEYGPKGTCCLFELPTAEEIAAEEAAFQKKMKDFELTLRLIDDIKERQKGFNWTGTEPCPVCGGELHLSHAAINGHVHVKCSTDGCLAWME